MTNQQDKLDKYFEFKCWKGLKKRGLADHGEYQKRLKYEIKTIQEMGFSGYFLIVADFLNWARASNVPTGPGRGSAAGSLASYCLWITNLDPIRFDLLFERFLNPDRVSMPDIDCDFGKESRDQVLDYVVSKYGEAHVAQIGTFGRMKARGAIRDTARTLGYSYNVGETLANLIPPPKHGKPIPLDKSYEMVPELQDYRAKENSEESHILENAERVEETIRSVGIHASGAVISPVPLNQIVPLFRGSDDEVVTQFEMNNIEEIGLIKFDFLGLRTLDVIHKTIELVKRHHGVDIVMEDIPQDDELTFQKFREGDTVGIFQLETSSGIRDLLIQIQPTELEDIVALVAMYRPGPLSSDGLSDYLRVRAGEKEPEYLFPELEPILSRTDGFMIYQEQIMRICTDVCGWTVAKADIMRKAIGKKKEKLMATLKEDFIGDAISNGIARDDIEVLWEQIAGDPDKGTDGFASYAFNKSHAACYALIAHYTQYLKAHYPVEFMCAALTCDADKTEKIIKYINECKRMGIKVLPPDINESESIFTISKPTDSATKTGAIRFGLSAVKNLGNSPVRHIVKNRTTPFKDIVDFASRVDLGKINKRKLESLALAGAFDSTGYTRASLLGAIEEILEHKAEYKKYESKLATWNKRIKRYKDRQKQRADAEENGEKKKGKLKDPGDPPPEPPKPTIPDLPEMAERELLDYEKELLGFYISGHPLDAYSGSLASSDILAIENHTDQNESDEYIYQDQVITLAGIESNLTEKTTQKGGLMAFGKLEDTTGQIDMVYFPAAYAKIKHLLKEDRPVKVTGKIEMRIGENHEVLSSKMLVFTGEELVKGNVVFEPIEALVKLKQLPDLHSLLTKYSEGEDHQVNISIQTNDGTIFRMNKVFSIGGNRSAFIRELDRINNKSEE